MIKHYSLHYTYELAGWGEFYKTKEEVFECNAPSLAHALKQLSATRPSHRIEYYESKCISIEEYENQKLAKFQNL